jgi:hypothetical protein
VIDVTSERGAETSATRIIPGSETLHSIMQGWVNSTFGRAYHLNKLRSQLSADMKLKGRRLELVSLVFSSDMALGNLHCAYRRPHV